MSNRAVVGAILGAVLGAACWSWVQLQLELDPGARCVDWVYGVMVAWGARWLSRGFRSRWLGWLCAGLTIPALLWGRWVLIMLAAVARQPVASMSEPAVVRTLAVRQCEERINAGETLEFREGLTPQTASQPDDFPPGVWQQAVDTWKSWTPDERRAFAEEQMRPSLEAIQQQLPALIRQAYVRSFQWQDLLWGGLALVSAFRMTAPPR